MKLVPLKELAKVDWGNTSLTKSSYIPNGEFIAVSAAGCDGRINHAEHQNGTLVLSAIGANCGKMFLPDSPFTAIKNTITICPNESVDSNYLFRFLNNFQIGSRGAGQPFITKSDTEKKLIPLPPLPQQQKIANILDAADGLRQNDKALIAKYDELTQSLFLDMFGDPRLNIAHFPKLTMDEIADKITDGDHATPKRETSGYKLLSCRNIKNGYIDFSPGVDYVGEDEFNRMRKRCNPEQGDILISCSGTIGRTTSVKTTEDFVLVRSAALVKIQKQKVSSLYMEYYLRTEFMQSTMQNSSKSSGQANLFTGPIKKLPVILPPLNIQNQFAERVAAIETQKAIAQASLVKSEELFNSLLQKAFKGELV